MACLSVYPATWRSGHVHAIMSDPLPVLLSICMFVCPSICPSESNLFVFLLALFSIWLFVPFFICLSIACTSVCLSAYWSVHLLSYSSVYLSVKLYIHLLTVQLLMCLPIYLSVYSFDYRHVCLHLLFVATKYASFHLHLYLFISPSAHVIFLSFFYPTVAFQHIHLFICWAVVSVYQSPYICLLKQLINLTIAKHLFFIVAKY